MSGMISIRYFGDLYFHLLSLQMLLFFFTLVIYKSFGNELHINFPRYMLLSRTKTNIELST